MAIPVVDFSVYQLEKENISEDDLGKLSEELKKGLYRGGICLYAKHGHKSRRG